MCLQHNSILLNINHLVFLRIPGDTEEHARASLSKAYVLQSLDQSRSQAEWSTEGMEEMIFVRSAKYHHALSSL